MAVTQTGREVIREYGPEMAGQNVAWVHAVHHHVEGDGETFGSYDAYFTKVLVGQVGEDGASYTVSRYDDGRTGRSANDSRGFEYPYDVNVTGDIGRPDGLEEVVVRDARYHRHVPEFDELTRHYRFGIDLSPFSWHKLHGEANAEGSANWVTADNFGREAKKVLTTEGAEPLYGPTYYLMAYAAYPESTIADPTMAEQTLEQIATAERITQILSSLRRNSTNTLNILDDAPTKDLPRLAEERFIPSRRRAHDLELEWREAVNQGAFANMRLYTPPGTGSKCRSWPFMNAAASDEAAAFGAEVSALRSKSAGTVITGLQKELTEISHRQEFATIVLSRLIHLAGLEAAMLDRESES